MNIRHLIWYFTAVLIIVLCFYLIPETDYHSYGFAIGIFTAALAAFFVFLGISQMDSISEIAYYSENPNAKNASTIIVPIAIFIIGTLWINTNYSNRLEAKIKKEGVIGTATIDSGFTEMTQTSSGNYSDNTIALTLVTPDNKEYKLVAGDVSSEAYQKVGVGLDVDIIYLPQNPKIFRILVDDKSIKKFKNISNRNIQFEDLEKFIAAKEPEELEKLLNKLSSGWERHATEEEGFGFVNNLKKEMVYLNPDQNTLFFAHEESRSIEDYFTIPQDRILKEVSDKSSTSYELDKYIIDRVNERSPIKRTFDPRSIVEQSTTPNVENIMMRLK